MQPNDVAKARIETFMVTNQRRVPPSFIVTVTFTPVGEWNDSFIVWCDQPGAYTFADGRVIISLTGHNREGLQLAARELVSLAETHHGQFIATQELPLNVLPSILRPAVATRNTSHYNVPTWHIWPEWLMDVLKWMRSLRLSLCRKVTRPIA